MLILNQNLLINYKNLLIFDVKNLFIFFLQNTDFWFIFSLKKEYYNYNLLNYNYLISIYKGLKKLFYNQLVMHLKKPLCFIKLYIDGLYYRIKYYKIYNVISFLVGYNHYILYFLPKNIKVFVHNKKRRFILYGFNKLKITSIASHLVSLNYPNLFKGKGIKIYFYNYIKKKIKKKR